MHILFDITLKLMLPWRAQPSGVDRLVFAHSRHWRQLPASQVTFVARAPGGHLAALPDGPARDYLAAVEERIAARPGSVLLTASSAILHLPKAIAALRCARQGCVSCRCCTT